MAQLMDTEVLYSLHDQDVSELKRAGGAAGVAKQLNTDLDKGIPGTEEDINTRTEKYGKNVNPEPKFTSFFELMFDAITGDTTVMILIVSAIISLALGLVVADPDRNSDGYDDKNTGWIEGTAILLAVAIVAVVTATNDYSKEKQFRKLNKVKENKNVRVVRGGDHKTIGSFDLVVGDIIILDTGDAIPADGIVFQAFNLAVDQSTLTGESDNVPIDSEDKPYVLAGTQVVEGVGKMIVTRVGVNSEWGKTAALLSKEQEPTPLQEKLDSVAETIGWIGLGAAILIFSVQMCYWGYDLYYNEESGSDPFERIADVVGFLITSITIVVVAVPEGLPLAVTISLAYSMQKMMKDNNLVRKLEACETMGGATDICSDKTGTLTQNKMSVVDCWVGGQRFSGVKEIGKIREQLPEQITEALCQNIALNSTASISVSGKFLGNQTECAMLLLLQNQFRYDYISARGAVEPLRINSFSSARKCMSVLVPTGNGKSRSLTKGAAELMLAHCTSYLTPSGPKPADKNFQQTANKTIEEMCSRGLRVLCLSYRDLDAGTTVQLQKDSTTVLEENMCCIGIVGIQDPLRPEAKEAVLQCQRAGITVRMVTGDNKDTAESIAREAGILTNGISMEGAQFRKLSPEEMKKVIPDLQVLSRSSPSDKYLLVKQIKSMKRVCCVTGDGTNDAPALKKADVGMSMGLCGTEVAKEASDIVLLDDNFASIVKSISWGRCVYDNIRKFLQFQLTVNLVALTTAFLAALFEYGTPLTAVQLLWVNLIMDTLAALALATEPPSDDSLNRKPYGRTENIISLTMWRNIISQGIFQLLLQYFVLVHAPDYFGIPAHSRLHHTLAFNVFVFCQVFNEFNSRRVGNENDIFAGVFDNFMFVSIILTTVIVQVLFVQFGGNFTQTVPLPLNLWIFSVVVSSISIPYGFIYRLIPVPGGAPTKKPKTD